MKHIIILSLSVLVTASPISLLSRLTMPFTSRSHLRARDGNPPPSCQSTLTPEQFDFPHYITQISKSDPDRSYGPQYSAAFTPNDVASIFAFDIPASRRDANCTVEFLFPRKDQLRTSSFSYDGPGTFFVKKYKVGSCPDAKTSWSHQPEMMESFRDPTEMIVMQPGNAYTISAGSCADIAGSCFAAMIATNDTTFNYFQDDDACPIGLYTSYV